MKFSIIITVKKITSNVLKAMPYFKAQTYENFEIIIVSEAKEAGFWNTKIIKAKQSPPAHKRNLGVKNATGDIIAFIDDDAYPKADWLKRAAEVFKDSNIVAIGGSSLPPKDSSFFQRVSNKVYELSSKKTGMRYGKQKKAEIDDWPTCNFFVRKKGFKDAGGFDEKYWGGEDTQLCYSLLKTKKKIIYDPEIVIYHYPRETLDKHLKQSFFWGIWRGFFMRLHKESRQLTFFIPPLLVLWLFFGGLLTFVSRAFGLIYLFSFILYCLFLITKGLKSKSVKLFFPVIVVTLLTQIIYGLGFLGGITSRGTPTKRTF